VNLRGSYLPRRSNQRSSYVVQGTPTVRYHTTLHHTLLSDFTWFSFGPSALGFIYTHSNGHQLSTALHSSLPLLCTAYSITSAVAQYAHHTSRSTSPTIASIYRKHRTLNHQISRPPTPWSGSHHCSLHRNIFGVQRRTEQPTPYGSNLQIYLIELRWSSATAPQIVNIFQNSQSIHASRPR